ncbi:MAG: ABC transporter ATP-binding protein [Oscillospiraceae bacterium]|nr:ABC transporter ATP-binding protein [Oscillospiraceae bacterium]
MIEVKNLTKNYGNNKAVDNISFTAEKGSILGFLGPNGAGKSTTMNILTGYISSSGGRAMLDGVDVLENPIAAKRKIGYLPEHPPVYGDMTVEEYLRFVYALKKAKLPRNSHLNEICELVKITDMRRRLIRNLSKGYKQRVGLAQALVGNPPILILDEPTVGLDPKQIIEIRSLVKKLGKNHTVILSSHILPEVQAVCDKIVIINKGKIVADDTAGSLSEHLGSSSTKVVLRVEGKATEIEKLLSGVKDVVKVFTGAVIEPPDVREYHVESKPDTDIRREVFRRLANRNYPVLMMRSNELSLEEIFLRLTAGDVIDELKGGKA